MQTSLFLQQDRTRFPTLPLVLSDSLRLQLQSLRASAPREVLMQASHCLSFRLPYLRRSEDLTPHPRKSREIKDINERESLLTLIDQCVTYAICRAAVTTLTC